MTKTDAQLADAFGAAAAALEDAEKVYKDAREAVVALGKPVLVGTKYTVDLTPKEILTFTVESLLAVGLSRAQIEALHRTTLDTPAVRKALNLDCCHQLGAMA